MAANTTYKVDIQYDLKGSAAKGLRGIGQEAKAATSSMGGLRSMLAMVGGGALLSLGKKTLIDFNSQVQKLKIGLATVTSMNLGVGFDVGQKAADRLFTTFQKMAAQSPATTKDFVEMANMISGGVLQAGMGLKELESITKGAMTASAALGAKPEMLALDVTQMLAGTVAIRDRYARQLLAGIGEKDYKKFNTYDPTKRAQLVQKSFEQPALIQAADAFGNSFEGVVSTLKDNLEIALGQVGMPLMKQLTNEIKSWTQWITDNPDKVASMIGTVGNGLKEAFSIVKEIASSIFPIIKDVMGVIKDVLSFMAENKDLLINVVKGMMVYKGLQMGGGMLRGAGGGLMGIFKGGAGGLDKLQGLGTAAGDASGGIMSMAGTIMSALPGLAKFAGILGGLVALPFLLNPKQRWMDEDARKRAAEMKTVGDYTGAQSKMASLRERLTNIGVNPDDDTQDLGGLKEEMMTVKASLKTFREKTLQEAIDKGMVREELNGTGTRRLVYTGSGGAQTPELMGVVKEIFVSTAKEARAEWLAGNRFLGPTADYSGVNGNMGFMTDYVGVAKAGVDLDSLHAPAPPKVNVTINKIEVYSDDPDRFVAQAVQSFEEVTRNPTQAHEIMRGAF